jgi:hypothetical protein
MHPVSLSFESTFFARVFFVNMNRHDSCCLCSRRFRKENGRLRRFKYEIDPDTGLHKLGGRTVRVKRKDPSLDFGCAKCYEELRSPEVSDNFPQVYYSYSCSLLFVYRRFYSFCLVQVGASGVSIYFTLRPSPSSRNARAHR